MNKLFMRLLVLCIVMLLSGMVAAAPAGDNLPQEPMQVESPESIKQWLCQSSIENQISLDGEVARRPAGWNGEIYDFEPSMPADVWENTIDINYINEAKTAAYIYFYSPSERELWIFPFWSLEARPDNEGNHYGSHDFCMPLIYTLQ